jgi:peptidoglycan/xylan/chitin deacetylase (PgdA/CDA1 family)
MVSGSRLLRLSARWIPSGALRAFGRPTVLVFHGVARRVELPAIEVNHHTVDEFFLLAKTLREYFDVLPLSALDDVLERPDRHPHAVFLTSDDGYLNTLTNAADILADLQLPWSLFVSTQHIDSGELNPLTIARLFFTFAPDGRYDIPHLKGPVDLRSDRANPAISTIRAMKDLDAAGAREALAAMVSVFSKSAWAELIERVASERFLGWPEVIALAARGVEIGAHAHWHWPMNEAQSAEYVAQQARVSREAVTGHVGHCENFAYPFGNARDVSTSAWQAVRDAGYRHAFTTMSATLDGGANRWLLPRYSLMPRERNLPAFLPMLRAGNARLAHWQRQLAG